MELTRFILKKYVANVEPNIIFQMKNLEEEKKTLEREYNEKLEKYQNHTGLVEIQLEEMKQYNQKVEMVKDFFDLIGIEQSLCKFDFKEIPKDRISETNEHRIETIEDIKIEHVEKIADVELKLGMLKISRDKVNLLASSGQFLKSLKLECAQDYEFFTACHNLHASCMKYYEDVPEWKRDEPEWIIDMIHTIDSLSLNGFKSPDTFQWRKVEQDIVRLIYRVSWEQEYLLNIKDRLDIVEDKKTRKMIDKSLRKSGITEAWQNDNGVLNNLAQQYTHADPFRSIFIETYMSWFATNHDPLRIGSASHTARRSVHDNTEVKPQHTDNGISLGWLVL